MITQKVKDSLKAQDTCPVCKANWKELDNMLHEVKGSENRDLGLTMLRNGPICNIRFYDEVMR
uniref:Uncharacterized protein n=1 Tax=viral metagenome TaxID=1070528 RepID=A0A6M3LYT7_9ZZZZ